MILAVLKSSNDFKDCIKYGFVNFTPALSMLKTPKTVLNHILDMDSHLVDSIPFIIYRCDTKLCELFAKVQIVMSSWSLMDMVLDQCYRAVQESQQGYIDSHWCITTYQNLHNTSRVSVHLGK